MSVDQRLEKLIALISEETGFAPEHLTDGSSLFHDFGVTGDDGLELLNAIANEFEIDMSDVDSRRYFGSESAYNPINHLYCFVRGKKMDEGIIRLEIANLKQSVESGGWQEPN